MRSKLTSLLAVLGATTILVLAANTIALAATGKGFLLGKTNAASKITTLARTTPGTALQVRTKSSANAPFAVNGKGKVANLNADTLDGLDSSALVTKPQYLVKSVINPTSTLDYNVIMPSGTFLFSYSAFLSGTSDLGDTHCWITQNNGSTKYVGESDHLNVDAHGIGLSASGLVSRSSSGTVQLHCDASTPFTTPENQPIQIILTKVNGTWP